MNSRSVLLTIIATIFISGCVSLPEGPYVTVLPGSGKSFDRFRLDDGVCREYAHIYVGGKTPDQVTTAGVQKGAVVGTAIGAAAGAAIDGGYGAGVGAATGLAIGSLAGLDAGRFAASKLQWRYDGAYIQCMYAKGHRVPISGSLSDAHRPNRQPASPNNARQHVPPDYYPAPPMRDYQHPPGS